MKKFIKPVVSAVTSLCYTICLAGGGCYALDQVREAYFKKPEAEHNIVVQIDPNLERKI